jgi:hypothetical protein
MSHHLTLTSQQMDAVEKPWCRLTREALQIKAAVVCVSVCMVAPGRNVMEGIPGSSANANGCPSLSPYQQTELVGNWCIHHGCSVCDNFKLFSFLFFPFTHLHRTVSHDTFNGLTLLWPMFLVTQHQYIEPYSVLIYFKQTNKQPS